MASWKPLTKLMVVHAIRSLIKGSFSHTPQALGVQKSLAVKMFKKYSLGVRAELPQTSVADSQPSPRAGRPDGSVEMSATEVWGNQP